MIICQIDKTEHESLDSLNLHLRKFKIKQADYYTTYFAKKDLLTGDPIPFKDANQYISQDFIDKRHMSRWLKENPKEGSTWAIQWLEKRRIDKNLIYAPSQVELRSLNGPTMVYFDSIGGYYNITNSLGFKDRYTVNIPKFTNLSEDEFIICDTREQLPLKLPIRTVSEKIDVGDYKLSSNKIIHIERKSLSDFVGTLNERKIARKNGEDNSLLRFDRELNRAQNNEWYVVMLVESSLTDALSFNYLPQMKWCKVKPAYTFKNLRDMLNKYPTNFQVVFVDGRIDASLKLIKILQMGEQAKDIDLQYLVEKGLL